ncbi:MULTISPECIES: hypothetical protein [Spirosoma]|uniref:Uncharacterized protein n=1 Tax=Spirosoma sordidisoli TaxID=2502893 RepID=A0A4Q2UFL6_9BACT|nr:MULTISPECIES: hypothetical protein [Spirosoma]RYC67182.1 hypothetical protein EQG79_26265 [Spirosoma sordidisoli]
MKKVSLLFLFLCLGLAYDGFSQAAAPADFFAGKWEVTIAGTPNGDVRFMTDLVRKDGKLTGSLKDQSGTRPEPIPITKVDEAADKITIYFNTEQAGEIGVELAKVDNDHLKGQLMNMFESTGVRVKN